MSRVLSLLESLTVAVSIALICAMVVTTGAQVVSRYLLTTPLMWTEETGRHLMIWMVFLSASVIYRRGQHISIDLLGSRMSPRGQAALGLALTLIVGFFFYLMVHYGWELVSRTMSQKSSALRYPMGYAYAALPTSGLLMLLYAAENAVKHFRAVVAPAKADVPGISA